MARSRSWWRCARSAWRSSRPIGRRTRGRWRPRWPGCERRRTSGRGRRSWSGSRRRETGGLPGGAARRRILLTASGIIALVFLVGFAGVAWQWQQAERQKDIAQTAERGEARSGLSPRSEADQSRRLLYASDMSLALHAWEAGTVGTPSRTGKALAPGRPGGPPRLRVALPLGALPGRSKYTFAANRRGLGDRCADGQILATRGDDIVCGSGTWPRGTMSSSWDTGSAVATSAVPWPSRRTARLWPSRAIRPGRFISGTWRPGASELRLQHRTGLVALAFSPDGQLLATGCHDGSVHLWDIATRREVCTLEGHTQGVIYVAFAPDGKTLASGSWDMTVRLWDVAQRSAITTFRGHTGEVKALSFSPDGKTLASARHRQHRPAVGYRQQAGADNASGAVRDPRRGLLSRR